MRYWVLSLILYAILIPTTAIAETVIVPADDFPPWKIVKDGKITGGIDTDFIDALLKGLNLSAEYRVCPWKRCLLIMKNGEGDLISGITLSKERQKYLTYLTPPYKTKSQKVLFVGNGKRGAFQVLEDMEHKQIGYLRGARYFDEFHENAAIKKYEVNTDFQGMKMVIGGRLDAFLITRENGEYLLQENPVLMKSLEMSEWNYNEVINVYLAISKKSTLSTRVSELEAIIRELLDSSVTDKK